MPTRRDRARSRGLAALLGAALALPATAQLDDPGKPAGQILVDPADPAWLLRNGEGAFFMVGAGDPEDFLYRGSRNPDGTRDGDQEAYIAQLAAAGVNALYFEIVRSHGDGDSDHDPWNVHGVPASGLNGAILDQWEGWFDALQVAGITLYFYFYDDSCCVPFGGKTRSVEADEVAFFEAIVDRFEHHPNLIWVVTEEYEEGHSVPVIEALAQVIRAADDHDHVIGVHQLTGNVFDFPDDPNVDHFAMQFNNVESIEGIHDAVVGAWQNARGRYNLAMSEARYHYDPDAPDRTFTRRYSWASVMGGAYITVLFFEPGMPDAILEDHGRMAAFLGSLELPGLAPHDELALEGTDYVLADPGRRYVLYAMDPAGDVGVAGVEGGLYDLRWLDPASGAQVLQEQVPLSGDVVLAPPPGFGDEVALSIAPGAPGVTALPFGWAPIAVGGLALAGVGAASRSRRRGGGLPA